MKNKEDEREKVRALLSVLPPEKRYLMLFLHRVQQESGWVTEEAQRMAAEYFAVPASEIYGLVTFYSAFRTEPGSKNEITVCQGTACHLRGSSRLVEELTGLLGMKPGQEKLEKGVSLKTVNCLGCCALAPVVVVNGKYFGRVRADQLAEIAGKLNTGNDE